MRETHDLLSLDGIEDSTFEKPARLVLPHPRRGGPKLFEVRRRLAGKGRIRLSATTARVFVDIDPGESEPPLIALDTIVRDDLAGLERMLLSVLPHVDEIVLGVDSRSGPEVVKLAAEYADVVYAFGAVELDMPESEWATNRINFSKARNIGRSKVKAPWTLVVDSDEYLIPGQDDLREKVRAASDAVGSFQPNVIVGAAAFEDPHRLARTRYRWERGTHNQLIRDLPPAPIDFKIVSDTSLRTAEESTRRRTQRDSGINELIEDAAKGDLTALFHLAKHRSYGSKEDLAESARLIEDFRLRVEPHSVLSDQRAWLAIGIAMRYYTEDDLDEADRWACRTLLDGPNVTAFCLLGDIAEDQGDLKRALAWYQAACAIEEVGEIKWPGITEARFGRLAGIARALRDPALASHIVDVEVDEEPAVSREAARDSLERLVGHDPIVSATVATFAVFGMMVTGSGPPRSSIVDEAMAAIDASASAERAPEAEAGGAGEPD